MVANNGNGGSPPAAAPAAPKLPVVGIGARPYRTVDDKIDGVVITFVDVTERCKTEEALREGERHQRLLLHELSHRVRNTLAVVQALARQTLRSSGSKEEFVSAFEGRLLALASAHFLLLESQWKGADLATLARQQLGAYASRDPSRIQIAGDPVMLSAELAMPFGLVLHELATNAAKYGALSNAKGKLAVNWSLAKKDGQRILDFDWRERDGPAVETPEKNGFGSGLVVSGIPNATVKRNFHPDGFECSISVPLTNNGLLDSVAEM